MKKVQEPKTETQKELFAKIVKGMDLVHERLIEYKKYKKTKLVIIRDNKIVRITPK